MVPVKRSLQNQRRFDEAAMSYFSPALSFFETLGQMLVSAAGVPSGASVLDVGCGTGAITLPSASAVGPRGRVVGADISSGMLDVAQKRTEEAGLGWTSFVKADLAGLELETDFDYAFCGFVMQMFDDLTTVPRALARHLVRGGKAGLSVWAKDSWEPHTTVFFEVMNTINPQPRPIGGNIDKLQEDGVIEQLMREVGFQNVRVETAALPYRLPNFDEYWNLCTTLGARAILEKLTDEERAETREQLRPAIQAAAGSDGGITISMDALFAFGDAP